MSVLADMDTVLQGHTPVKGQAGATVALVLSSRVVCARSRGDLAECRGETQPAGTTGAPRIAHRKVGLLGRPRRLRELGTGATEPAGLRHLEVVRATQVD